MDKRTWKKPESLKHREDESLVPHPRKGEGDFRHCYLGQEVNLLALLRAKNMNLEEFNRQWDKIDPDRDPAFRPR